MITVISPAKSLDFESSLATKQKSQPQFLTESTELIKVLKKFAPQDISSLMKLSDKLSILNYDRFRAFKPPFTSENARQAVLAFQGDVYQGLDAASLNATDFKFMQKHLCILSGLYGVLRPLDLIQAYRLEMGTKLKTKQGNDLYQFWDKRINEYLSKILKKHENPILLNLASNEYFKSVKAKDFKSRIITAHFKDYKNGQFKIISFFAKRARGLMSRFIVKNQIDNINDLKDFNLNGYYFDKKFSSQDDLVFLRKQA